MGDLVLEVSAFFEVIEVAMTNYLPDRKTLKSDYSFLVAIICLAKSESREERLQLRTRS